jgi:hypothetical protein
MRNILAAVGAAVVAFLAVGWYLGWYQISSTPSAQGPQSVQVDINPNKITTDVKKGVENGEKIVDSFRDPANGDGKAPANGSAKPTDSTGSSSGGPRPDAKSPPSNRGPGN